MNTDRLIRTFSPKLDTVFDGGVPSESFIVLAGEPGSGKSIFIQQWLFHYLRNNQSATVLYLTTMSEPPAKTVRYMRSFEFFDPKLFQTRFQLDDLGATIRDKSLEEVLEIIIGRIQQSSPKVIVIDSFKAIRDLATGDDSFRHFVYQFAVRLNSLHCTAFLVGEYTSSQILDGAEFAVADGIIIMSSSEDSGEYQRSLRVSKMRGRNPVQHQVPFWITKAGIEVPTAGPSSTNDPADTDSSRRVTGIDGLDALLTAGLASRSAVLISGVSGTGKTTLALQTIHHAVETGGKALYYSFEETIPDLMATASGFGWDLSSAIDDGLLHMTHVPQSEIRVEHDLSMIADAISLHQPQWVVLDSFSVFLYRISDPADYREKMYQVKRILSLSNAVGLLLSDIPAASDRQLSRMGVEETIADGAIILSTSLGAGIRRRLIEVYKMRRTAHVKGEHRFSIGASGIDVYYQSPTDPDSNTNTNTDKSTVSFSPVQTILSGGLRYDSAWLVRGEPGTGKSTMAVQFAAEGLKNQESVLIVTADSPERDILRRLSLLGVDVNTAKGDGRLRILDSYSSSKPALSLSEFQMLLHTIQEVSDQMNCPQRIVFDSITPFSVLHDGKEFVRLVHEKNRVLQRPGVVLMDTHLYQRNTAGDSLALLNGYDIVIDLNSGGTIQIAKVRDVRADRTPRNYTIEPNRGIAIASHSVSPEQ